MYYVALMRTTLTIDDDVMEAARAIAGKRRMPVGEVISELARKSLNKPDRANDMRNGVPLLPPAGDGKPVTLALVNRLRDELP